MLKCRNAKNAPPGSVAFVNIPARSYNGSILPVLQQCTDCRSYQNLHTLTGYVYTRRLNGTCEVNDAHRLDERARFDGNVGILGWRGVHLHLDHRHTDPGPNQSCAGVDVYFYPYPHCQPTTQRHAIFLSHDYIHAHADRYRHSHSPARAQRHFYAPPYLKRDAIIYGEPCHPHPDLAAHADRFDPCEYTCVYRPFCYPLIASSATSG
jgi:hypothetical protein